MFDELAMLHGELRCANRKMAVSRCTNAKPFVSERIQAAIDEGVAYIDDGDGMLLPRFRLTERGAEAMADMACCMEG